MIAKSQFIYSHVLHWVIIALRWKLEPNTVTCNFDKLSIKYLKEQFGGSIVNGCLFHGKQVLCRKILKLKMNREHISYAMTKNVMDELTVIPRVEIIRKVIPYVRSILDHDNVIMKENAKFEFFYLFH